MQSEVVIKDKFDFRRVFAISIGHFWIDYYMALLPSIVPFLVLNLKMSQARVGFTVMVMSVISSVLQPLLGYYIDKRGKAIFLSVCILWISILMSSIGIVNNFILIIILSTLASFGSTLYHPLGSVIINLLSGRNEGLGISMYSLMGNFGFAIAPLIIVPLVDRFGDKGILFSMIPGIVMLFLFYIIKINDITFHVKFINNKEPGEKQKFNAGIILLTLIEIMRAWAYTTVSTFIAMYFVFKGFSQLQGGYIQASFSIVSVFGMFLGGYLASRIKIKNMMIWSLLLTIVFFSGFAYSKGALSIIFIILSGFTFRFCFNISILAGKDLMPNGTGMVTGLMMGFAAGIGSIGAFISGIIADRYGISFAMHYVIIFVIFALILNIFFKPIREKIN